ASFLSAPAVASVLHSASPPTQIPLGEGSGAQRCGGSQRSGGARTGATRAAVEGRRADVLRNLVEQAAENAGLERAECRRAGEVFAALTVYSLAEPSVWPSEQLSVLSMGSPLEFSVTARVAGRPALRYAVEVGAPYLSP